MAKIVLGNAPSQASGNNYRNYRTWLLKYFFDNICSYCLLRDRNLAVDHYEPQQYAPHRTADPSNLLLACSRCNGPGGKSDYHPCHKTRRRLPHDKTGYLVIDVRNDDFAKMFGIRDDGKIYPKAGKNFDRAAWNIALLKLDLPLVTQARRENLQMLLACERAVDALHNSQRASVHSAVQAALQRLLPQLRRQWLLFEVFEIPVSDALRNYINDLYEDIE